MDVSRRKVLSIPFGFGISGGSYEADSYRSERDWAKFGRNLSNTSSSPSKSLRSNISDRWIYDVGEWILSGPAVVDGVVYFGAEDCTVYALEAETGRSVWTRKIDGPADCSPAIANGRLYIGNKNGSFYCLDASTGLPLWKRECADKPVRIRSSPAVYDGKVYFGDWRGNFHALDSTTGHDVWVFSTDSPIYSSPAISRKSEKIYFGGFDGTVYSLDAGTGDLSWCLETDARVVSSPAVTQGTVYVASEDSMYSLDSTTGEVIWRLSSGFVSLTSSPAIWNGKVSLAAWDSKVYVVDMQTGEVDWSKDIGGNYYASNPVVTNGVMYIGSTDGYLYGVELDSGDVLWKAEVGYARTPSVSDGVVYTGSYDGRLYALTGAKDEPPGSEVEEHTFQKPGSGLGDFWENWSPEDGQDLDISLPSRCGENLRDEAPMYPLRMYILGHASLGELFSIYAGENDSEPLC